MNNPKIIDHLFRHHYGKMVSILVKVFGLPHLQIIEDAVQDTFYKAVLSWRTKQPENPEAWLTKSARNRVIDILRKINADSKREQKVFSGTTTIAIQELFNEHEIEDSQLRMIFTACHPSIKPIDQIAFALKTISGFSTKEIASALLAKEETVKKRLSRARKKIVEESIAFSIPEGDEIDTRINRVHEVLYLIFNEGYHSNKESELVRKDLVLEAIRLCKLLVNKKIKHNTTSCAVLALMLFHTAKIEAKISDRGELINLEEQDRSLWNAKYIFLGNSYMNQAVSTEIFTSYHYEAAIIAEHLKAKNFESTDWNVILMWYKRLLILHPTSAIQLNIAIVYLQLKNLEEAFTILTEIDEKLLGQRAYIFHATWAEYLLIIGEKSSAIERYQQAIQQVNNQLELEFLKKKLQRLQDLH